MRCVCECVCARELCKLTLCICATSKSEAALGEVVKRLGSETPSLPTYYDHDPRPCRHPPDASDSQGSSPREPYEWFAFEARDQGITLAREPRGRPCIATTYSTPLRLHKLAEYAAPQLCCKNIFRKILSDALVALTLNCRLARPLDCSTFACTWVFLLKNIMLTWTLWNFDACVKKSGGKWRSL